MKEQLQHRLAQLQAEYDKGQKRLQELELETANLRNTLLRISGAMQVLSEELEKESDSQQVSESLPEFSTNEIH